MFVKTTNVGFAQRVVATLVACAVVMASYGFYTTAQAANLTFISNTLTDSNPGATSAHTIQFQVPTSTPAREITSGELVRIDFETGFTGISGVGAGNVDVTVDSGAGAVAQTIAAFDSSTGNGIEFTGVTAGEGDIVVVAIEDELITNPALIQSFEITVTVGAGATQDVGKTRVAIVDNVLVTAIVDTEFEFIVSGLATSSGAINADDTTGSSTSNTLPFGTLTAGTPEVLGQELTVETNARNGFSVTVQTDGDLRSSTGAIIDNFQGGSDIDVAGTAWAMPVLDINNETTWGQWGVTSNDADLANDLDSADSFIAASTTPREIFSHDGPSDGSTQDIGLAQVAYKIEITTLQEAADDYQTILTYIATPTF